MVLPKGSAEPLARFPVLRTADLGEAESVVSVAYVPHRLSAAGRLDARLNVVRSGGITLGYLGYGTEARLTVPPSADSFHVNVPVSGTTTVRQGSAEARTVVGRRGAMVSPTRPATLDWSADAAQFAIKIERRALERQLSALLHDAVSRPLQFSLTIDLRSTAGAALLTATRFLAGQLELQEPSEDLVRQQMESFVLTQVLLGIPNSYSSRLTASAGPIGRFALDETLDYIENYPERPLGLAELAAVAGTSATALRAAFRDALDTTPADYVRGVRLARAHAELTGGEPDGATLRAVAGRWGFPVMAEFTLAYRARYGTDPAGASQPGRRDPAPTGQSGAPSG